jgi:hypothetical protein
MERGEPTPHPLSHPVTLTPDLTARRRKIIRRKPLTPPSSVIVPVSANSLEQLRGGDRARADFVSPDVDDATMAALVGFRNDAESMRGGLIQFAREEAALAASRSSSAASASTANSPISLPISCQMRPGLHQWRMCHH